MAMEFSLHPGVCVQDIGGQPLADEVYEPFTLGTLRDGHREFAHWEGQVHACVGLLVGKGLLTLDEMRRGVESLTAAQHTGGLNYYERWSASVLIISLERGTITQADLDKHMGPPVESVLLFCSHLPKGHLGSSFSPLGCHSSVRHGCESVCILV